jgi:uncharacterized protein YgiM (DUF1202 family)
MIAAILLFTFCSAGAAALYAFGRRQSSRQVQLAAVPAAVAEPVVPRTLREDVTSDTIYEEEAGIPRWLRASVRAERAWTPPPRRPEPEFRAQRAADAFAALRADAVRTVVRSDQVNLLDGPNESYAAIVGRLHRGDEVGVVLMDRDWAEVRTSTGASGWVPTMTLAVADSMPPAETPEEAPSKPVARRARKPSGSRSTKRKANPPPA